MKIALLGYGKMGKEIEKIALERNHEILMKIDSFEDWNEHIYDFLQADVAIEFSTPATVLDNIVKSFAANVPIVVGTTGWHDQLKTIKDLCQEKQQCLFYASNFSIGVNIFFEINKKLAGLMNTHPEYEVFIEEVHHLQKLDSPSGTAITLADDIIKNLKRKESWKNEMVEDGETLGIKSVRDSNVPGTHIITYKSANDEIEIKHQAQNRLGFAMGAILAAEFIQGKKGIYQMKDLLF
ncbi:MAG: 4-hydroxy-tetrahydrodipicolinate reductase [Bacteroidetes bacterium]|nr:4-hydroxy-tetrahydrodipicolinate reductase [Bacteroidota bacterium]